MHVQLYPFLSSLPCFSQTQSDTPDNLQQGSVWGRPVTVKKAGNAGISSLTESASPACGEQCGTPDSQPRWSAFWKIVAEAVLKSFMTFGGAVCGYAAHTFVKVNTNTLQNSIVVGGFGVTGMWIGFIAGKIVITTAKFAGRLITKAESGCRTQLANYSEEASDDLVDQQTGGVSERTPLIQQKEPNPKDTVIQIAEDTLSF